MKGMIIVLKGIIIMIQDLALLLSTQAALDPKCNTVWQHLCCSK